MTRSVRKYLKLTTIILGGLYMPLAMFIGYSYGVGSYLVGSAVMGVYILLSLIDGIIFWKLLESRK